MKVGVAVTFSSLDCSSERVPMAITDSLSAKQAAQTEEIEPVGEPAKMTKGLGALAVAVCLGFFGLLVIPLLFWLGIISRG